jgi:hypothetical protein
LGVTGPGTFDKLYPGFIAGQVVAAAIALVVARGRGPEARPWLWAALFSLIGGLAFATVGGSAAWRGIYAALADVPAVPIIAAAAAAGAVVAWSGWNAGKREVPTGALPA